ncbi:hypothetical protein NA56DRAFT_646535 [Hyaloscypha hepaticicola]|uniref:Uncharacterized protein n=1 Tax=Hyaloscypha hepaticicola TaxID=2082293 RepID=A0A2J6Q2J0_9HELO|nr:hypothetical protein NA56DRAFT_646535 [Hyaloscypha hepaticicola]
MLTSCGLLNLPILPCFGGCRTSFLLSCNRFAVISQRDSLRNGKLLRLGRRGIRNIKSDAIQDRFEGRRLVEAFKEAFGAK